MTTYAGQSTQQAACHNLGRACGHCRDLGLFVMLTRIVLKRIRCGGMDVGNTVGIFVWREDVMTVIGFGGSGCGFLEEWAKKWSVALDLS